MDLCLEAWNKIKQANGQKSVTSVDPSQADMFVTFREVIVQEKQMFIPVFKFDNLTAYRANNTADLNYILEVQSSYLEEEFGIKLMPQNFRLGSIDIQAAPIDKLALPTETANVTVEDDVTVVEAEQIFDHNDIEQVKKH